MPKGWQSSSTACLGRVRPLSSNPSTARKKKEKKTETVKTFPTQNRATYAK
jgi:hypothetical protein